ncbi:hypothetical protein AB4543_22995 [Vibrio splendidus]
MDALLKFAYTELGLDKGLTALILLVLYACRKLIMKAREDGIEKTKRISNVLKEIEKHSKPRYHYCVEQVFLARYDKLIDFSLIKYFLNSQLKTASRDFLQYLMGARFVVFDERTLKLSYKRDWNGWWIYIQSAFQLATYLVFGFIGVLLLILLPYEAASIVTGSTKQLIWYVLMVLSCLFLAGNSLHTAIEIQAAIKLVRRHNPQPSLFELIKRILKQIRIGR